MTRAVHVICGDFGGLAKALSASSKDVVSLRDYLPAGPLRDFSGLTMLAARSRASSPRVFLTHSLPSS